jgi:hypothetical protein
MAALRTYRSESGVDVVEGFLAPTRRSRLSASLTAMR